MGKFAEQFYNKKTCFYGLLVSESCKAIRNCTEIIKTFKYITGDRLEKRQIRKKSSAYYCLLHRLKTVILFIFKITF